MTTPTSGSIEAVAQPAFGAKRAVAVLAGVLLVSLGAQAAVPIPGNPVPITLQVPAVLIVGGLLGPALGSATLVLYLLMGAAGLPVFAPTGTLVGFARLIGPTGGYLLAYPVAAGLVGQITAGGRSWARLWIGLLAGLVVIHAGGVAQLAALGGDLSIALRFGSLPFLLGDCLKVLLAGLVIRRLGTKARAAL
ncbi:MAG: biotin transporter BioY [Gemmatimonadetes bacterium]|nr:biotin transporter BioY [Gemmatimonadota bacterium]